jgi:hypothetical protein
MWKASSGGHRICCRSEIPTILPSPYRRRLGSVLSEVRLDAVETNEVEGVRSHKAQRRLRQTIMRDPILAFERIAEKQDRLTFSCSRQDSRDTKDVEGKGKCSWNRVYRKGSLHNENMKEYAKGVLKRWSDESLLVHFSRIGQRSTIQVLTRSHLKMRRSSEHEEKGCPTTEAMTDSRNQKSDSEEGR